MTSITQCIQLLNCHIVHLTVIQHFMLTILEEKFKTKKKKKKPTVCVLLQHSYRWLYRSLDMSAFYYHYYCVFTLVIEILLLSKTGLLVVGTTLGSVQLKACLFNSLSVHLQYHEGTTLIT